MRVKTIADVVAPQVPLCPLPLVILQCRSAAKEYLVQTRAWTEVVSGAWDGRWSECRLDLPMDSTVTAVHEVRVGGRVLAHLSGASLLWPASEKVDKNGPRCWRFGNGKLELFPYDPDHRGKPSFQVEALVALTIDGHNPALPDWLDADEIAYGAMVKLYEMAGQTWSNPSLAAYFDEKFRKAIADKRISRDHGGKPGSLTMKTPSVGGYF